MIKNSLVGKLWLAIVILVILVMFFLGLFLSQFFEDFYFSLKSQELARNGQKLVLMIASAPYRSEWEDEISMISKYIDAKIVVTDKLGLIRSCTINGPGMHRGQRLEYPEVEKILEGKIIVQRGNYPGLEMTVLTVGIPIEAGNEVIGAVFLHSPVEPVTQTVRTVQKFILYGAVGTIFLATILGFILTKRITKPILDMNRVAMEMAKGNFREKVDTDSEDEIGLLGTTLNYLSTELQNNIEALSTEKDQLENILASMTDIVVTFDTSGDILLMNQPAVELFHDQTGASVSNIEQFTRGSGLKENVRLALDEKAPVKTEVNIDNQVFNAGITPLRNEKNEIRGVVTVLHEVTMEKRLENLRREFVANVSHELRGPLSLLQGYVEALADGLAESEEEKQRYLDILLDETLRLRRLVNDLLDLTQLETGNMSMKLENMSAQSLIIRVTERFIPLFKEQRKDLRVSVPENLPLVMGDEDRLQQVLVNLLDNAIKYTPEEGTVKVVAEKAGGMVEISVTDSGPGIPQEELEKVWERFYKADKARIREAEGGTGLGLAIVRSIIQGHGGEVRVTSEKGQGTTFTFTVKVSNHVQRPFPT